MSVSAVSTGAECGTALALGTCDILSSTMPPNQSDLAREILQYLLENPEGKDTFQGIARFWILGTKIDMMVDDLHEALRTLVDQGYLNEKTIPGPTGRTAEHAYELNSNRIGEIAELIKKRGEHHHDTTNR